MTKQYLGDGVYVEVVPQLGLLLTTENGITVSNRIVLEPEVYTALVRYVEELKGEEADRG